MLRKSTLKSAFLIISAMILSAVLCAAYAAPDAPPKNVNYVKHDPALPGNPSGLLSDIKSTDSAAMSKIGSETDYPLSLYDAIMITLQNNLDIKISNYDSEVSKYELESQKGIYDATFSAKYIESLSDTQSSTDPDKTRLAANNYVYKQHARTTAGEIALSQLLPSGAYVQLAFDHTKVDFQDKRDRTQYDPYYSEAVGLTVKQPLLKGFGSEVTNAGINISRISKNISTEKLKRQTLDQIYDVISTYWDLVYSIENLKVQELSLKQANDLLRINTIKYETGVLPSTDVLQAKAQVAAREEQIIIAKSAIKAYQDQLKRLMNIKEGSAKWSTSFVPNEKPIVSQAMLNEEASIRNALENHPDVKSAQKAIEINKIGVTVAASMQKPELNVFGGYGYTGANDSTQGAFGRLGSMDYADWQVGLELKYPLLNREARNTLKKNQTMVQKSELTLKNVQDLISLAIRNAVRNVETNFSRINITKAGVTFEEAKLDAEQKRYDVGMSTSFNILTFQEDLATAKVHNLSAIIDYNKALAGLEYSQGSLLDTLKIKIDEPKEEASFLDKINNEVKK